MTDSAPTAKPKEEFDPLAFFLLRASVGAVFFLISIFSIFTFFGIKVDLAIWAFVMQPITLLFGWAAAVVSHRWGSSRSSAAKDQTIAKIAEGP